MVAGVGINGTLRYLRVHSGMESYFLSLPEVHVLLATI